VVIRFHLDESAESGVANGLRRRGIDVTTPHDVGLAGASDAEQLSFALRDARVIVTHDRDFLRDAAQGLQHAGIAYCPHGSRSIGDIVRSLILLHDIYMAEEMVGRVEFL
jgi:uncharacterized protein DUF5615